MDTIAVHAHFLDLCDGGSTQAPDRWYHDLATGSVTYRFGRSPNTFTWDAPAVASMVAKIEGEPSHERARELVDRWDAIARLLEDAGRTPPDRLLVDHETDEMTLVWEDPQRVVVVGQDGVAEP
jgi:hypothetical protein